RMILWRSRAAKGGGCYDSSSELTAIGVYRGWSLLVDFPLLNRRPPQLILCREGQILAIRRPREVVHFGRIIVAACLAARDLTRCFAFEIADPQFVSGAISDVLSIRRNHGMDVTQLH